MEKLKSLPLRWMRQPRQHLRVTDFIKGPPSATGILWDRSTNFRDTKKAMETVTKNGINTSNPTLARNVKAAITQLRTEFPVETLSSANKTKILAAVETLCYVQKNGYVTSRKHVEGYKVCMRQQVSQCVEQTTSNGRLTHITKQCTPGYWTAH